MIQSMTGFGAASVDNAGSHVTIEIRSVNSKFLKINLRLPEDLASAEPELEQLIRSRISRGTLTLRAMCTAIAADVAHGINHAALQRYIDQLQTVLQHHTGKMSMELGALLRLPGVLIPPDAQSVIPDAVREAAKDALNKAIDEMIVMRAHEGAAMASELRSQINVVRVHLETIRANAPNATLEFETRLMARIEKLLERAGVKSAEPADIVREVASYAERVDINEEISRLSTHLDHFESLLAGNDAKPIGRTLDFLSQEMLREANTIGSKSPDASLAHAVVEIKGAIDRIKEMVQNIE